MNKKKRILIIALVFVISVIIAFGIYFGINLIHKNSVKNVNSLAYASGQIKKPNKNPIDFKSLKKKNNEIYGWIKVDGTTVDYPILQSEKDDEFYLDHNVKKDYDIYGAIYTESANSKNMTDRNTVLYGHNMLDGSMFASLHKFRDKKFFDKNKYIYIYIEKHVLKYEIFAAYKTDDAHILNSYDFSKDKVYKDYLENAQNPKSLIVNTREAGLTVDDKIVTLSTCIGNEDNYRYIIQGVLRSDTETE